MVTVSSNETDAVAMPTPDAQNSPANDTYRGCVAIGKFIGEDPRRTNYLAATRQIPAIKMGGKWVMRGSRYLRMLEDRENERIGQSF